MQKEELTWREGVKGAFKNMKNPYENVKNPYENVKNPLPRPASRKTINCTSRTMGGSTYTDCQQW